MSGLYQRALAYQRRSQLTVLRPEDNQPEGEDDLIPPEERANVLKQIDTVIESSRTAITPARLEYRPKRRGIALILIVNVVVLAVAASSVYVASLLLNSQEASLAREPEKILTTESKVIAALKEESNQQLRRKDQEILAISDRLDQANAERQRLNAETQKQLDTAEEALRAEYDAALQQQRAELAKGGLSEEQIDARLAAVEAEKAAELDRKLVEARLAAQREVEARDTTIAGLVSQYQAQLQGAQAERAKLQSSSQQRVADLEGQLAQSRSEGKQAADSITQELRVLQQQHENERLVLEQLVSSYDRAGRLIDSASYDQALSSLNGMRSYLDQQNVAALPVMQRRRPVELFLVGSLEDLIRSKQAAMEVDTRSLLESANLLASVADIVRQGEASLQASDSVAARLKYEEAIRRVPAAGAAYDRIAGIDSQSAADRRAAILKLLGDAYGQYRTASYGVAVGSYRNALGTLLGDQKIADQVTDTIERAGLELLAADERSELTDLRDQREDGLRLERSLAQARERYAAEAERRAPGTMSGIDALAALLQTKVLLLRVLDREEIRAAYPDLSSAVDRYLSTYGEQRYAEGRRDALLELAGILDGVAPSAVSRSGRAGDPVLEVLDRLIGLMKVR